MGGITGRLAMMGITAAEAPRPGVVLNIACTEADCLEIETQTSGLCTLTGGGHCFCLHEDLSTSNVTCHICVVGDFSSCCVFLSRSFN